MMTLTIKDGGDVTELLGEWINANQDSDTLVRVNIEQDQEGVFWLEANGGACWGKERGKEWGKVVMDVHQGGREQSGFHASVENNQSMIHLAANYKLGVLVIELFCAVAGQPGTILREFFRRAVVHQPTVATPVAVQADVAVDLSPFVGTWFNTSDHNAWLQHFTLSAHDQGWQLALHCVQFQPDPVTVISYLDNMGYLAFKAEIQLADRQLIVAANTQTKLVVMTSFERFEVELVSAGKAHNRGYREIFYLHEQ